MARPGVQISVAAMLGLIACAALNFWLFRFGFLVGVVGLNVTKHVGVAVLCRVLGVNGTPRGPARPGIPRPHALGDAPGALP